MTRPGRFNHFTITRQTIQRLTRQQHNTSQTQRRQPPLHPPQSPMNKNRAPYAKTFITECCFCLSLAVCLSCLFVWWVFYPT